MSEKNELNEMSNIPNNNGIDLKKPSRNSSLFSLVLFSSMFLSCIGVIFLFSYAVSDIDNDDYSEEYNGFYLKKTYGEGEIPVVITGTAYSELAYFDKMNKILKELNTKLSSYKVIDKVDVQYHIKDRMYYLKIDSKNDVIDLDFISELSIIENTFRKNVYSVTGKGASQYLGKSTSRYLIEFSNGNIIGFDGSYLSGNLTVDLINSYLLNYSESELKDFKKYNISTIMYDGYKPGSYENTNVDEDN